LNLHFRKTGIRLRIHLFRGVKGGGGKEKETQKGRNVLIRWFTIPATAGRVFKYINSTLQCGRARFQPSSIKLRRSQAQNDEGME